MYLLKHETAEMVAKMTSVETDMTTTAETLKEREKKSRVLGKAVLAKENELDKAETKLEATVKKIKEKDAALMQAQEDTITLNEQIAIKEAQLKQYNEQFGHQASSLVTTATK